MTTPLNFCLSLDYVDNLDQYVFPLSNVSENLGTVIVGNSGKFHTGCIKIASK